MRALLAVFLFLSTFLAGEQKPAPVPELVFTNVSVVDTRTGQVAHNLTVVVKNGRIASLAKLALIGRVHDVHVVNASGKYLIPGLWDMHVHSAGGSVAPWDEKIVYPLQIANGVTGIRDMGGDPALLEQRRSRIEKGELLGPHIIMAGPFLTSGKSDAQTIGVNTPAEGRQAVDTLKKRGVDFIKILSVSHESYTAIADEAAKQHIPFVGHVPEAVSVAEASVAGQRSIEHLGGFLLACSSNEKELRQQRLDAIARRDGKSYHAAEMQALATYSADKAQGLFIQLRDNGTWQVPTLVWTQADASIDDPKITDDARLKYVPASTRREWDPADVLKQIAPERLAERKKVFARYVQLAGAMRKEDVPFLAGSDGPDPYVYPGFSLHDEMELLVKAGFSPAQALQAATLNPALFLGKLDEYGVVEKGRVADLVLLDGDPIEDIRNTRKIDSVVLRGKLYSREDLDKILAQVEELAAKE
jgi:imidazolonepropionase-like amidohydrolase